MQRKQSHAGNAAMHLKQKGFTLPEVLMALSIGSFLMLSSAQLYPLLRQRSQSLGRHFQLDQLLRSAAFNIEKDLRRSGFCNGECEGSSVVLGNSAGEASHSCVIIAYDLNRNGRWEPAGSNEAEHFGYRLRDGGIEMQRAAANCSGNGWDKLLDPAEVNVTAFMVTRLSNEKSAPLFSIDLAAQWRKAPEIHRQIAVQVAGRTR